MADLVMADLDVEEKFAGLGMLTRSSSQDEFRAFLAAETAKYAKLVTTSRPNSIEGK